MREGSLLFATAIPRRINRLRFISYAVTRVNRFYFRLAAVGWKEWRRVSEDVTRLPHGGRSRVFSAGVEESGGRVSLQRSECVILPRVFYSRVLRVARACIITPHLHREAEGLNSVRTADARLFFYFFLLSVIAPYHVRVFIVINITKTPIVRKSIVTWTNFHN